MVPSALSASSSVSPCDCESLACDLLSESWSLWLVLFIGSVHCGRSVVVEFGAWL